ncbi:phage tail tape measure protein [Thalassospira marina]|uniref:Phage tail tape measure protein n=1 Tax=Thalassospira marina TaxID=2048283 RepID=A0A2N3KSG5_9PROT|nr:phage tail tape measure protein [Thalassospira marina]PKR53508.1 phage tail tape measure protein [Thalassospira marina]
MTTLAVSIEVGAILKDGLKTAFSQAETASAALDREVGRLNQTAATMTGWREAKRQTADARGVWQDAERQAAALERQLAQTETPSKELRAELTRAKQRVDTTKTAWREAANQLRRFDGDMKAAGIETKSYAASLGKVETAVDRLTRKQKALGQAQNRADKARSDRSALGGEFIGAVASAGTLAFPIVQAIRFEAAMAGVKKAANLTKMETVALGQELRRALAEDNVPLDRIEAAGILEAAAQAGLARDELIGFTTDVAKAKIALDMTADQAGGTFAAWRSAMRLNQKEAVLMADAVNHLSNNSNAVAADLANVITRQGATAQTAGLARNEIAALSAFMLSAGQGPEMTATALKNLTGSMSAGIAATGRQKDAFEALGYSATDLAERMQEDAQGTILEFFQTLSEQDKTDQRSLLSMVVGEESLGVIAPLLTNLDGLRGSFRLVANEADYAGSMFEEYNSRTDETDMKVNNAWIAVNDLATVIGKSLTPTVGVAADAIAYGANAVSALVEDYPNLTAAITLTAAALVGFRVAKLAVRFAMVQTRLTLAETAVGYHRVTAAATIARARMSGWSFGGMISSVASLGGKMLWLARSPVKAVMGGLRMLKVAALTNPITAIPAILGFAAELAISHWDTLSKFVKTALEWMASALDAIPFIGAAWEFLFGDDEEDGSSGGAGPSSPGSGGGDFSDDASFESDAGFSGFDDVSDLSEPRSNGRQSPTVQSNQNVEINIYQQQGESAEQLAERVKQLLEQQRNDGALYDVE